MAGNGPATPLLFRGQSLALLDDNDALEIVKSDLVGLIETASPSKKKEVESHLKGFQRLFEKFLCDRRVVNTIRWENIRPFREESVVPYADIKSAPSGNARKLLDKLVVLKLNGGLGTTMGCVGPKSLISVRSDHTFLDLTVEQIEHINSKYKSNIPLVLMNSFNTHADTERIKFKYEKRVDLRMFQQSYYPRILKETLRPYPEKVDLQNGGWYPPGHGDVYLSLKTSGLLEEFRRQGKEVVFISNIDNLGATVDVDILNQLLDCENGGGPHDFVMEVTDKTRADVKGGTLILYQDKLRLLEIAQVPKDHVDEFKSIKKFKIFNTNNLWARLDAIDELLSSKNADFEVIANKKSLNGGINVIQLETAAGAAIGNFDKAIGINVPRSRFLPVKKTSDLLLVMSNLFNLRNGTLVMNPARVYPSLPLVKLGDPDFTKVREFLERFDSIPEMLDLDHLTVSGDVTFGKGVSLRGTVIIIANHGDRIDIPANACLENKIVSGNLRIRDH